MIIDKDFKPSYIELEKLEAKGTIPFALSIGMNEDIYYTYRGHLSKELTDSYIYLKKIFLSIVWMIGGNKIYIKTTDLYADYFIDTIKEDIEAIPTIQSLYKIFHGEVTFTKIKGAIPKAKKKVTMLSKSFDGCRIGFDAGGSDRKVTATIDGLVVYEKETVWLPKENPDWTYHRDGILSSMQEAAQRLPRVDAVGVSTAGIVIDNKMAQAALFVKVNESDLINHVENIYKDIISSTFPHATYNVINDGDISAIAGAMWLKKTKVLGLAFGTSEASGYCISQNKINGYFNELGKVPLDFNIDAPKHKTMNISGAGSMYLSQNGVIRLAEKVGFNLEGTLAEKLKQVQSLVEEGNEDAIHIFMDMGIYLATALILYSKFYDIHHVIILGRVTSKKGGNIMLESCKKYLKEQNMLQNIEIHLPDETFRRLGQSYVAASIG